MRFKEKGGDETLRALGPLAPSRFENGGDASLAIRAYGGSWLGTLISPSRGYQFSNISRGVWISKVHTEGLVLLSFTVDYNCSTER